MVLATAVLAAGLSVELDLGALLDRRKRKPSNAVCGITVVGYRIKGVPGQQFGYGSETFTIPPAGQVEVIGSPQVKHVVFDGRELSLDGDKTPADDFGFRRITLPASTKGANRHE